ncbi:MAG: DUF4376 domain-containing protein [Magnetospirillum sp.]|nr:DUF4376 domain-containing protein [Magnetospirillum sp.]
MDWYHKDLGYLSADAAFTLDEVQYPSGWLRHAADGERTALGFVPTTIGAKPDERYYWVEEHRNGPAITYTGTPKALDQIKALRLADLKVKRDAVRNGGITVGGILLATDRDSCSDLTGKALTLQIDPTIPSVNWKVDGVLISIPRDQFIQTSLAISHFVQACFDNEGAHSVAIGALTDPEAVIAYDIATGWGAPSAPAP